MGVGVPANVEEYRLKAEFIERFSRFVKWPEGVEPVDGRPLVIGVVGDDPFGTSLDEVARKWTEQGRPIVVQAVTRDVEGCHLLFITASEEARLSEILATTADRPILTIGDAKGFGERGVLINFFLDHGKVRFEVNHAAVRRSGLELSSKLLKLARDVGPKE